MADRTAWPARDSDALAAFLAGELRLPLAALSRVGRRLVAESDPALAAVGRAVGRECERLDVLVMNALEIGLVGPDAADDLDGAAGRTDLVAVVEKAVAGQRAFVEAFGIRVRVVENARNAVVAGQRAELGEAIAALVADLLERVPRGGRVEVSLRDVAGFARLDCGSIGAAEGAAGRAAWRRSLEVVARLGGELWATGAAQATGFGLALPLVGERTATLRSRPHACAVDLPAGSLAHSGG